MKLTIKYSILACILAFVSCKKGGTGGNTTIVTIIKHHERLISNGRVYIKYGSYNFAGVDISKYDSNQSVGKDGNTHFENLSRGYYSFYCVAYDSLLSQQVSGHAEIKIKQKDNRKELELKISVTE